MLPKDQVLDRGKPGCHRLRLGIHQGNDRKYHIHRHYQPLAAEDYPALGPDTPVLQLCHQDNPLWVTEYCDMKAPEHTAVKREEAEALVVVSLYSTARAQPFRFEDLYPDHVTRWSR
jgi:hypothetical protein